MEAEAHGYYLSLYNVSSCDPAKAESESCIFWPKLFGQKFLNNLFSNSSELKFNLMIQSVVEYKKEAVIRKSVQTVSCNALIYQVVPTLFCKWV